MLLAGAGGWPVTVVTCDDFNTDRYGWREFVGSFLLTPTWGANITDKEISAHKQTNCRRSN